MEQEDYLVREEPVRRLERIVFALWRAAGHLGPDPDRIRGALRVALSAKCVRCGMRVSGEELIVLSQFPEDKESRRIQRLRSGCCAREECNFENYELHFQKHPGLDWPALLSAREPEARSTPAEEGSAGEETPAAEEAPVTPARSRRTMIRVGLLLAVVVLLFVFRQLYYGGRIPLIREPEKFRVDPAPERETNSPAFRR
jgi:hypothetical protein